MDGHNPFYIGQHWCKSKEDFLDRNYPYYGSGSIWNDFLKRLKKDYPQKWRYFIRREILCFVTNEEKQSTLNKLEKYWIEKEMSHYSLGLGGCNVIIGASIESAPSRDPIVAKKISETLIRNKTFAGKNNPMFGRTSAIHYNEDIRRKVSNSLKNKYANDSDFRNKSLTRLRRYFEENEHPMFGKKHSEEAKNKMSEARKKWCAEHKEQMSAVMIGRFAGEKNYMYGKHLSDEQKEKIRKSKIGKHLSEETKKKISLMLKGRKSPRLGCKMSEEQKLKISISNKGKTCGDKHYMYGKPALNRGCKHSDEAKEKMKAAWVLRKRRVS